MKDDETMVTYIETTEKRQCFWPELSPLQRRPREIRLWSLRFEVSKNVPTYKGSRDQENAEGREFAQKFEFTITIYSNRNRPDILKQKTEVIQRQIWP